MSITGSFELNSALGASVIRAEVRRRGFPSAEIECPRDFPKQYLVDLRAFDRSDAGTSQETLTDLQNVAVYLIGISSDGEILYSQGMDLRNPEFRRIITIEDLRDYPPAMSGEEGLYVIKKET